MGCIHTELDELVILLGSIIKWKKLEEWTGGNPMQFSNIYGNFIFVDKLVGIEELWFVGDNFLAGSYRVHFKKARFSSFIKENYEVFPYCNSRSNSANQNLISHLQISMANAVNELVKLPSYIVVVSTFLCLLMWEFHACWVNGLNGWSKTLTNSSRHIRHNCCKTCQGSTI